MSFCWMIQYQCPVIQFVSVVQASQPLYHLQGTETFGWAKQVVGSASHLEGDEESRCS